MLFLLSPAPAFRNHLAGSLSALSRKNNTSLQQARRFKVTMTEATTHPLSGLWRPSQLQQLWYGPDSVPNHLLEALPNENSKAFIITGSSLATKTSLVKRVEDVLGKQRHAGTFHKIRQHAPIADIDEAADLIFKDHYVDTVISIGGGSPIDSAKAISYRSNEKSGRFLHHIAIPTTLSAAECTFMSGFTNDEGKKVSVLHPKLAPHAIFYDSKFGLETPPHLFMTTGFRAMDHAIELMYHPTATEIPARQMALSALSRLFTYLPKYKEDPKNEDHITNLFLACFASLGFIGTNLKGGLGLSHALGYALGSPYSIPHGVTSCLTLGSVVKLKAEDPPSAEQIARVLPFIGHSRTGNDREDAEKVGDEIIRLVHDLGLATKLGDWKVGQDQAEVITQLATRAQSGTLYDKVLHLVKGLY